MRTYCIAFTNEEDKNKIFDQLFEVFKNSEDFKTGKIVYCRTVENGTHKIYLTISDRAAGSYSFIFANAFDKPLSVGFLTTKADCKDLAIKLPVDCSIASTYEPDKVKEKKEDGNDT